MNVGRPERAGAGTPAHVGRIRDPQEGATLSPMEVGALLKRAHSEGVSLQECATAIQLEGTGQIARFLRIGELPDDVRHLVDWGGGKEFVGFTAAVELAKLRDANDQRSIAKSILADGLSSKEVRQVVQLRRRSGRGVGACVAEVLGMRPQLEKRYVFVGSVAAQSVEALRGLTQAVRNAILLGGIHDMGLRNVTGRLGPKFFTLVGREEFDASMREIGRGHIEARLRGHISEAVQNAAAGC